jgi:hypothetical protein
MGGEESKEEEETAEELKKEIADNIKEINELLDKPYRYKAEFFEGPNQKLITDYYKRQYS